MAHWNRSVGQTLDDAGQNTTDSAGLTLTAAGSANTKGSYSEITSSILREVNAITVYLGRDFSAAGDYLVDIAIGASSSEQVVISNILFSSTTGLDRMASCLTFPIYLPSGERLSARVQSSTASATIELDVMLHYGGGLLRDTYGRVETYGASTADSGGTSVDPGGTVNTKGAYSQIVASTNFDIESAIIAIGNQQDTSKAANHYGLVDIAVGAASSEVVVIENIPIAAHTTQDCWFPRWHGPFPLHVPAGTRLAARAQADQNSSPDRLLDVVIYGIS